MKPQGNYNVGIYLRLSHDDPNSNAESMSIANQKALLTDYVLSQGWTIVDYYSDDGYTGTTFDRPAFKRLIADIERGLINLVITKDLSRLGRNYIQTGSFIEYFFPQHNVRYIALGDNYDSIDEDNDILPFKNILNELYAKDISKKIRATKDSQARQGKFTSSIPAYGYTRSPEDNLKLVPDETTGPIIQRIFNSFDMGDSGRHIGEVLNSEGILSPQAYYYYKTDKPMPERIKNRNLSWSSATIMQILKNPVYLGITIRGRRKTKSFKDHRREFTNPEDWIVVENTHEALISREVWDRVQARIEKEKRTKSTRVNSKGEVSLFSGIVRCGDCNAPLAFNNKIHNNKSTPIYRCGRYAAYGKSACSPHSIRLDVLEAAVLADIRQNARLAVDERDALVKKLIKHLSKGHNNEQMSKKNRLNQAKSRLSKVEKLTKSLFEDKADGLISIEQYNTLMKDYENERALLTKNINLLSVEIDNIKRNEENVEEWVNYIKQLTDIQKLDRPTVITLIDHITVLEKKNIDGIIKQEIAITYKFVGSLDSLNENGS